MDAKANHSPARVDPAALTASDACRLLSAAGAGEVREDMISADITAGAPTNPDGTLNLVHYAAWLVRQLSEGAANGD
jgi:hypothetical protein